MRVGGLVAWCVVAALLLGCTEPAAAPQRFDRVVVEGRAEVRDTPGRTVVLGIDALGPRILRQALDEANVPALRALVAESAMALVDVRPTEMPPLSPRVWATFATGVTPQVHGIKHWGDQTGSETRLYTSRDRKVPALWDIASALGTTVGVVNWLTTYPAEPVNGFVVADRFNKRWAEKEAGLVRSENRARAELAVYPPELREPLEGLVPPPQPRVLKASKYEAIDRSVFRTAVRARRAIPVDLLMVYTRSFDEICHLAWFTHDPPPGMKRPGRDLVMDYLELYDRMLAGFVNRLGDDDHLVVVSDHGFERGPGRNGRPQGIHRSPKTATAVLLLRGPRIRRGARVGTVSALDVAPTILELAGLPSARSLPGKVVAAAFRPDERSFVAPVESYELRTPPTAQTTAIDGVDRDPALVERLRALGYLE